MCWETRIGWHFCKTTRDFSQGLSPSRGGISHHCYVISHVSEVLSKSNTSVDRSFSGSDRHVRGVGDKAGSLHDRMFLSINFNFKLWELIQYLSHLVSSFTASDVDNTFRVGVFRKSLGNTSFTATESSWNSTSSAKYRWIKSIEYSLASKEWLTTLMFLDDWSWGSYRPHVAHLDLSLLSVDVFDDADWLTDIVLSSWHNLNNSSISFWVSHDMMVLEKSIFSNMTNDITTGDQFSNLKSIWVEIPHFVLIKARQFDSSWDENVLSKSCNRLKRSLNTVENCFQDTWS